jgi:hypothetical protein
MMQEIITYLIIGAAVALAFSKIFQKVGLKKKPEKKVNFRKENFTIQNNCSDCSAECMLRNTSKPLIEKNKDLCKEIEIRPRL